jgi:FMN phosphatase YigB (HAD superfamily)
MIRLIEAILTFSDHFGENMALDLEDPKMIAEALDVEMDSDYFEEVIKALDDLRHKIGSISASTRTLRDLVKYGEAYFNERKN